MEKKRPPSSGDDQAGHQGQYKNDRGGDDRGGPEIAFVFFPHDRLLPAAEQAKAEFAGDAVAFVGDERAARGGAVVILNPARCENAPVLV